VQAYVVRVRGCRGIVVVIGIAVGESGKQVMAAQYFIPGQLPETDVLVGQECHVAIYTVLVVTVDTELEEHMLLSRQLVGAEKLPSAGVDALTVHLVATAVFRCPIHLSAPPVFIYIARSK